MSQASLSRYLPHSNAWGVRLFHHLSVTYVANTLTNCISPKTRCIELSTDEDTIILRSSVLTQSWRVMDRQTSEML